MYHIWYEPILIRPFAWLSDLETISTNTPGDMCVPIHRKTIQIYHKYYKLHIAHKYLILTAV